ADGSSASLHPFVPGHIQPGATVITDAWMGYHGLAGLGYVHQRRSQRAARARGDDPGELLPTVHRVASLAKRWVLGTHQGSVDEAHLPGYLNEFAFRFNRRRSRSRGLVFYRLLELAVGHDPVRYHDLIVRQRSRAAPPTPPGTRGHPPSLERPGANRPWRAADMQLRLAPSRSMGTPTLTDPPTLSYSVTLSDGACVASRVPWEALWGRDPQYLRSMWAFWACGHAIRPGRAPGTA